MVSRLFVYGTLAPGGPNEYMLTEISETFRAATVRGVLHHAGWGITYGYPATILDDDG